MDYKHKLEELILTVIHEGGSDLHLGAGRVPVIRVSGELIFLVKHPVLTKEDMIGVLGEVLEKTKVGKFMENQEADFSSDSGRYSAEETGIFPSCRSGWSRQVHYFVCHD